MTRDGKYLVYSTRGSDPTLERLCLADRQVEVLTHAESLRRVVDPVETANSLTLAPDWLRIRVRDIGRRRRLGGY
jgi:hypothetical protein